MSMIPMDQMTGRRFSIIIAVCLGIIVLAVIIAKIFS